MLCDSIGTSYLACRYTRKIDTYSAPKCCCYDALLRILVSATIFLRPRACFYHCESRFLGCQTWHFRFAGMLDGRYGINNDTSIIFLIFYSARSHSARQPQLLKKELSEQSI